MSTRAFLTAGLDLSLLPSAATNAQILQAIQEAKPASALGFLIYQSGTPDVATYTEYATFIWINTSTGELKYWNGSSWQLISGKASIADSTVTISKLSPTGGSALQLIRINSGATAFEFVNPADIFSNNTLPLVRLVNAAAAGYVMYSGVGGVWESALLTTLLNSWLATKDIPLTDVVDTTGIGLPNQVAYLPDTFDPLSFAYVESLLRNNQTPFGKMQFPAGSASKYPRVNVGGTDFDFVTNPATVKCGVVKYSVAAGTAAQTISTTGSLQTVQLNTEVDPDSFITLASNQFTLPAGSFGIDIYSPVYRGSALSAKIISVLRDITGASNLATSTSWHPGGAGSLTAIHLKHSVTLGASNVFEFQLQTDQSIDLGIPANLGSIAETYQQIIITKYA